MIREELAAFDVGVLQDGLTLMKVMRRHDLSEDDVWAHIKASYNELDKEEPVMKHVSRPTPPKAMKFPKCPKCGRFLYYRSLPENPKGYTYSLFCTRNWDKDLPSMICGYEEFHKGELAEHLRVINERT